MSADSLAGLLTDAGIRPKHYGPAHTEHLACPRCHGGKTREKSLSLTIDSDGSGAAWVCHRGKCGWKGGGKVGSPDGRVVPFSRAQAKPAVKPEPHRAEDQDRPDSFYAWFAQRGIGAETVDAFGCYRGRAWFGPEAGDQDALVFPYLFRGELVNRKFRSLAKQMRQEADALPTLFNVDAIETPDVVCWVEGEPDVMALHEVGYPQTVSLKDGAPAELRAEEDPARGGDRRFAALDTHGDMLSTVERFVLAGDADQPGTVLREELARRLGRHRCWIVTWPAGCKDACDVLRLHGADAVRACVEAAQPYPIEGVQQISGDALDAYLELPAPRVMGTGVGASDAVLKLPGEGRLIVVTGIPNAGKSQWTMFVMVHLMRAEARRFLIFSPEMQPWKEFAVQVAQVYAGKPARPVKGAAELMSRGERIEAGEWLRERCAFLCDDAEDEAPTLEWIMDRARDSVLRMGITDLLIDPWNEVEHQRGTMTETDYIGRSLQQLKAFAGRHGCNVWIIAHPSKMHPAKPGERLHAPGPYDISGSANWANKPDVGLTIHTPDRLTELHVWKCRFSRWGRKGGSASLQFNPMTGVYSTPTGADLEEEP